MLYLVHFRVVVVGLYKRPKTGMGLSVLHLTAMSSFDMDCEEASLETSLNDSPNHKSKP